MRIGVPKEIKSQEYRVGLTPESISELVADGHELWVETQAGEGIGAMDADYKEAGAKEIPDRFFADCKAEAEAEKCCTEGGLDDGEQEERYYLLLELNQSVLVSLISCFQPCRESEERVKVKWCARRNEAEQFGNLEEKRVVFVH